VRLYTHLSVYHLVFARLFYRVQDPLHALSGFARRSLRGMPLARAARSYVSTAFWFMSPLLYAAHRTGLSFVCGTAGLPRTAFFAPHMVALFWMDIFMVIRTGTPLSASPSARMLRVHYASSRTVRCATAYHTVVFAHLPHSGASHASFLVSHAGFAHIARCTILGLSRL